MSARVIGRTGAVRGLDQPVSELLTVGSGRTNELRIDSRTVSRQHAQIVKSGTQYYVEDLGSRNGTFLNGQRVRRFPVRHLDVLSIGPDADLIFLESGAAIPLIERRQTFRAAITWIDGPLAGRTEDIAAERGLLLGRRPELEELGAISRRHAVLTIRDDRLTVEDLGSANGTWINGSPIDAVTRLEDGDEVSLANLLRLRVSILTTVSVPRQEEAGTQPEPETVVVDRPAPRGGPVLERPPRPPAPAVTKSPTIVVPSPPPIDTSPAPQPTPVVADATRVAPREPAIAPAIVQNQASTDGTTGPIEGGATQVAPREPLVAPWLGGPAVTDLEPMTFAQPRESAGGVPPHVMDQALAARAALAPTDAVVDRPVESAPPSAERVPAPAASGSGAIVGLRLEGTQPLQLNRGTFSIGRHPDCDIHLDARDVGRRHARLVVGQDRVTIEDLGTANGTFVNDQAVTGETEVPDGSRLRFATVDFTVAYSRAEGQTS